MVHYWDARVPFWNGKGSHADLKGQEVRAQIQAIGMLRPNACSALLSICRRASHASFASVLGRDKSTRTLGGPLLLVYETPPHFRDVLSMSMHKLYHCCSRLSVV